MDLIVPILLQFVAGTLTAAALAYLWSRLQLSWPGIPVLGGLGGVTIGELRGHILGGHHHMAGMDMSAMPLPAATLSNEVLLNLAGGAVGGGTLLLLAAVICWLVPNR